MVKIGSLGGAAAILVAAVFVSPVSAQLNTVAPAGFGNTDATFNTGGPFGSTSDGTTGRRYQQIFDASLFSGFGGERSITSIQFRASDPENTFRPNSITASNTLITLSTTGLNSNPGGTGSGSFSATFAANVGADVQTVYSGALTLDRGASNATGPQPFVYGFTLQVPFDYDPSMGNLLLDVIVPAGATVTQGAGFGAVESFDASVASNDGTASVSGTGGNAVGAAGQTGLITQFTSVPEPTSLAMLGVAGTALLRRRRA